MYIYLSNFSNQSKKNCIISFFYLLCLFLFPFLFSMFFFLFFLPFLFYPYFLKFWPCWTLLRIR